MSRSSYVKRGSPPSAYAIQSLLEGEEGSVGRVMEATLLRTVFLLPGLYFTTDFRGTRLVTVAFAGSASITVALMLYYLAKKNGLAEDDE